MFIKIENQKPTGHPITTENLKYVLAPLELPPAPVTADVLPHGYATYEYSPTPEVAEYQVAVEDGCSWDGKVARQKWKVRAMTNAERQEYDLQKASVLEIEQKRYEFFRNDVARALVDLGVLQSNPYDIPVVEP